MSDELRWPPITKDPDEEYSVALRCFSLCATFWRANEDVKLGDIVWPNIEVDRETGKIVRGAIGLLLECTEAGRTGSREPRWIATTPDGASMADQVHPALDGSARWTYRRPQVGQGITPITNPSLESITPAGAITVLSVLVDEDSKILVDYSKGGEVDTDYEAKFVFFVAGREKVGRQIIRVRKK